MKQKTTLHTTMNAINTFFVGFRHISFCGSRIDRSTYKSKGKPRNILAAVNQSSFVMTSNVHGDSALVNAAGGAVARPLLVPLQSLPQSQAEKSARAHRGDSYAAQATAYGYADARPLRAFRNVSVRIATSAIAGEKCAYCSRASTKARCRLSAYWNFRKTETRICMYCSGGTSRKGGSRTRGNPSAAGGLSIFASLTCTESPRISRYISPGRKSRARSIYFPAVRESSLRRAALCCGARKSLAAGACVGQIWRPVRRGRKRGVQ
jgi:hypothetical protein